MPYVPATRRRSLPLFEEALELELAVDDAAIEQPVAAEHAVLVRAGPDSTGARTIAWTSTRAVSYASNGIALGHSGGSLP